MLLRRSSLGGVEKDRGRPSGVSNMSIELIMFASHHMGELGRRTRGRCSSPSGACSLTVDLDLVPHRRRSIASSLAFFSTLLTDSSSSRKLLPSTCYIRREMREGGSQGIMMKIGRGREGGGRLALEIMPLT